LIKYLSLLLNVKYDGNLLTSKNYSKKYFALVTRRTVLHDLTVLAIHRTMQINSRPTDIIIYIWKQKVEICVGDEFD